MSIIFMYKRIFGTRTKGFKIALYVCMFYVTGWMLSQIILILVEWQAP